MKFVRYVLHGTKGIYILGARLQGPRLRFGGGYGVRSQLRIRFEGGSRQIGFIDTFLAPVCR